MRDGGVTSTAQATGAGIALVCAGLWLWNRRERQRLETELSRVTQLRASEREGRVRAEKKLRTMVQQSAETGEYSLPPIGTIHSPFVDRRGTPRQGCVVSQAACILQMEPYTQPELTLDGLEGFSHLWLTFLFHENTNAARHLGQNRQLRCKSKVRPPRLEGRKVGCLAVRTPHRPNPIGLTLARIHSIDKSTGRIHLRGVDCVHGTPILDIKPYIPYCDAPSDGVSARVPEWVQVDTQLRCSQVHFSDQAQEKLRRLCLHREEHFHTDYDDLSCVLQQLLARDLRSLHQRRLDRQDTVYELRYDGVRVEYNHSEGMVEVVDVHEIVE